MATLTGAAAGGRSGPDISPYFTDGHGVANCLAEAHNAWPIRVWRYVSGTPYEAEIEPGIAAFGTCA